MDQDFRVKVGEFEGPLDLLLGLIEKRKMHISDVSLAQVADEYISHMHTFENYPMSDMANFILVASTLMLIKSMALLPGLAITEEERESIENLENRLKHYQKIKELSAQLKERFGQNIIFAREPNHELTITFSPTEEIKTDNLWQAIRRVIMSLPKKEILPQTIVRKVISLEEVINNLAGRIQSALKIHFSDVVKDLPTGETGKKDKVNIIVSFLGMLELVKQGIINIEQSEHFADIKMESNSIGVPRY